MKTTKHLKPQASTQTDDLTSSRGTPQLDHFKDRQKLPLIHDLLESAVPAQFVPANELELGNFYHL